MTYTDGMIIPIDIETKKAKKQTDDFMKYVRNEVLRANLNAGYPKKQAAEIAGVKTQKTQKELDTIFTKTHRQMLSFGLSIMFFGMAVKKATEGLLKPAAQVAGIFDVMGSTLELLFLPIMLVLLEYIFIPMLEYVSKLDDNWKLLIGGFIIFIAIIGTGLMIFGQLVTLTTGLVALQGAVEGIGLALGVAGGSGLIASLATFGVIILIVAAIILFVLGMIFGGLDQFKKGNITDREAASMKRGGLGAIATSFYAGVGNTLGGVYTGMRDVLRPNEKEGNSLAGRDLALGFRTTTQRIMDWEGETFLGMKKNDYGSIGDEILSGRNNYLFHKLGVNTDAELEDMLSKNPLEISISNLNIKNSEAYDKLMEAAGNKVNGQHTSSISGG